MFGALLRVARYRPAFTVGIVLLSLAAAVLEGVGIGFILPIIEQAQSGGSSASGLGLVFERAYALVGVPFTLEYIVAGVAVVMAVRFTTSFVVRWLSAALRTNYVRDLQTRMFDHALDARISYFDQQGSDEILNAIITQSKYAGRVIYWVVRIVQLGTLCLIYLLVALYLAPALTVATAVVLGLLMYGVRTFIEGGYSVGDRVASANELVQEAVQAGTQGIRDVKLFGMTDELSADFDDAIEQFADSTIALRRNDAFIDNSYQFIAAVTVFALIYFAVTYSALSLGGLGVFLFAMFRLGPRVSELSNLGYKAEGDLPHLVRTERFIAQLQRQVEPDSGSVPVPDRVDGVGFEDVHFSYGQERVLRGVSFAVDRGEFVAFVGRSGAGKSTIVSLLTRMYEPDDGQITAADNPIDEFDTRAWRSRISVVRQNPFVFNDTLRYNVTVGNREASDAAVEEACEIARVTEFLDDLPDGYDTVLGDDGVRLSGGQRQRVAIARALLKDADVLVLDEATSDLDTRLESEVHAGIEAMDRDYVLVVIAHRLSTVTNADRIYTMSDGRITEQGNHQALLEADGEYASLHTSTEI